MKLPVAALLGVSLACGAAPDAPEGTADAPIADAPDSLTAPAAVAAEPDAQAAPGNGGSPGDEPAVAAVAPDTTGPVLAQYDFTRRLRRFDLPGRLDEISGLAFTADGRLFAHDDERGRLHEIDPVSGEVGKRFDLGAQTVRDDFEGLTIVGARFFLVSSTGFLYEFAEGADGDRVGYRVTDTGLGRRCEIEGIDYDPLDDVLLVACKESRPVRDAFVVHRLPMDPARPRPAPLVVPFAGLPELGLDDEFAPSGVAVDPGGNLLLVSGRDHALVELSREGAAISGVRLSSGRHPQPEGLAIGPDGTLYIADERNGRDARLTAYERVGAEGTR